MGVVAAGLWAVAALCAGAAAVAWRRRDRPGAAALTVLLTATAFWNGAYALELVSPTLEAKLWWARVQYGGIVAIPPSVLAFALHFRVGGRVQRSAWFPLLAVVPLLVVVGAWTNDAHGLIWQDVAMVGRGAFSVLDVTYGSGFFVWWAYAYGLLFAAAVRIVSTLLHVRRYYRRQFAVVVAAVVCPWIGNAVYVLDVVPGPALDFTNAGFAASSLLLTAGSLRWGLLDVLPISRDFVVEHMDDAMVLVDPASRIVDCNAAARHLLRSSVPEAIGQPADEVVTGWPVVPTETGNAVVEVGGGAGRRCYEAKVTTVPTVGGAVGRLVVFHDVTAREELQAHLRERAMTDALTGLPNRRLYLDRLEQALAKAVRTGEIVAVLYCDLDDFKPVNDAHGHDAGDEVLLTVAHRLRTGVRVGDTVARLGGDEFAVLLERLTGPEEAEEVAHRLAERLAQPIPLGAVTVHTPGSIGIAVTRGGGATSRDLLREADRAMYTVKGDPSRRIAVAGRGPAATA